MPVGIYSGELLADHAEDDANSHETGANQDDLQSDVHKNSLSFVRECRERCAKGGHSRRGSGAPFWGVPDAWGNVRYTQALRVETKEIL